MKHATVILLLAIPTLLVACFSQSGTSNSTITAKATKDGTGTSLTVSNSYNPDGSLASYNVKSDTASEVTIEDTTRIRNKGFFAGQEAEKFTYKRSGMQSSGSSGLDKLKTDPDEAAITALVEPLFATISSVTEAWLATTPAGQGLLAAAKAGNVTSGQVNEALREAASDPKAPAGTLEELQALRDRVQIRESIAKPDIPVTYVTNAPPKVKPVIEVPDIGPADPPYPTGDAEEAPTEPEE